MSVRLNPSPRFKVLNATVNRAISLAKTSRGHVCTVCEVSCVYTPYAKFDRGIL